MMLSNFHMVSHRFLFAKYFFEPFAHFYIRLPYLFLTWWCSLHISKTVKGEIVPYLGGKKLGCHDFRLEEDMWHLGHRQRTVPLTANHAS